MQDRHYVEYRDLGLSIFFYRKTRGLTQQQLAEMLEVNYETISRIENASSGVSVDMLIEICKALKISMSELFAHAKL